VGYLQEGVDAVGGSAEPDERDDGDPDRVSWPLVRPRAQQLGVVGQPDHEDQLTGSRTVASTLALSAIDSSGAPGMRMTVAASSAAPRFAA
jgi:hypothetical protein